MVLGEKIALLRKQKGWSQEDLAERLDISRQSVSKWESGTSVPDLDKIIKVSELFQVSTDFLLKDETDIPASPSNDPLAEETTRCVTMEEANAYMDLAKKLSGRMALAVSLLIVSPVCLIQLGGIAEFGTGLTEDMAGGIGVAILLLLVAIAVAVLVLGGMQLSKYEYLEKEVFLLQHGVKDMVEQKRAAGENRYRAHIAAGVVLCIIGVVPLMLAAAFRAGDFVYVSCVNALLFFIACGVHLFVRSGLVYGSYQKLLQDGDYTRENKEINKRIAFLPGVYWCIVTAVYLAISFHTSRWDTSWIVWPVAGVLFAAIYGIASAAAKIKK